MTDSEAVSGARPEPGLDGRPVRVVVCDDSPFMQRMLRRGLDGCGLDVVGTATTAGEAIELCRTLRPDVLTLDLDLGPDDGIEVLRGLRDQQVTGVRVMVVSSYTTDAASERAVGALAEGAIDCMGKPGLDDDPSEFVAELAARLGELAAGAPYLPPLQISPPSSAAASGRLIIIGASTGGPRSLQAILPLLPADLPGPILIVQHLSEGFHEPFVRHLSRSCMLDVRVACDGALIEPGVAHIARSGQHLHIDGDRLQLRAGRTVNGNAPSVDVTMIDAAASWGGRVTSFILSGIGSDGRAGARAVRAAGGRVIVEDQSTCAVYGMPRAIVDAGLADEVLPLEALAQRLVEEAWS